MGKINIIYYSANHEKESFEKKVMQGIKEAGYPIISVTQKPVDLGKNICVGKQGHSYLNAFRQILIGCEESKADFVAMAESDCLYPKGYFDFKPTDKNVVYTYDNAWVLWEKYGKFFKKQQTHGSVMYGRKFLIEIINKALKGLPEWSYEQVNFDLCLPSYKQVSFTGNPVVCVKTKDAPNRGVSLEKIKTNELYYWGKASEVIKKYEL